jgi:hypothetical protein
VTRLTGERYIDRVEQVGKRMPTIYRITYPNGKIYVGSDTTDDLVYFGSVHTETVAADFTLSEQASFTITKDVLWMGCCSRSELVRRENEWIRSLRANDPAVGYNRTRFKTRD